MTKMAIFLYIDQSKQTFNINNIEKTIEKHDEETSKLIQNESAKLIAKPKSKESPK